MILVADLSIFQPIAAVAARLEVLLWASGLLIVLLAAFLVVRKLCRHYDPRLARRDELPSGLTIEQIDALHDAGSVSDEEFATMRRIVLNLESADKKDSATPNIDGILKGSNHKASAGDSGLAEK